MRITGINVVVEERVSRKFLQLLKVIEGGGRGEEKDLFFASFFFFFIEERE